MVGSDTYMCGSVSDHLQDGLEHAGDGAEPAVFPVTVALQPVKVTKELVGTVDKVDDHFGSMLDLLAAASKAVVQLAFA